MSPSTSRRGESRSAQARPCRAKLWLFCEVLVAGLLMLFFAALPVLAAEDNTPDPTNTPAGTIFRWLNFALVMGGIVYLVGKSGAPYFRAHARSISNATREASDARAAADRELREVDQRVAALNLTIQDLRRKAVLESNMEAERIRELARTEAEKIHEASRTEIAAIERAGVHELREIAARLAVDRAAELVRERVNREEDAELFRSFVGELERSAS